MSRKPLQTALVAYSVQGKPAAIPPVSGKQLEIHDIEIQNRSGVPLDAGVLRKYPNEKWSAGKLVDLDTPDFTDSTLEFQAGSNVDLFEANNDGILIQTKRPVGLIGFNVDTGAGAGGVWTFEYFDGTSFVTLPTIAIPDFTSTGSQLLVFGPPVDWVAGSTVAVGGDTSLYSIRILSTTAPATAVTINEIWAGEFIAFQDALADSGVLSIDFPDDTPLILDSGEGIMPYFSVADSGNMVSAIYSVRG